MVLDLVVLVEYLHIQNETQDLRPNRKFAVFCVLYHTHSEGAFSQCVHCAPISTMTHHIGQVWTFLQSVGASAFNKFQIWEMFFNQGCSTHISVQIPSILKIKVKSQSVRIYNLSSFPIFSILIAARGASKGLRLLKLFRTKASCLALSPARVIIIDSLYLAQLFSDFKGNQGLERWFSS